MAVELPRGFPVQAQMLVVRMIGMEGYTLEHRDGFKKDFLVRNKQYKEVLQPTEEQLMDEVFRRYGAF